MSAGTDAAARIPIIRTTTASSTRLNPASPSALSFREAPLAGTSGLLEDAPSARRLPDLRHRGGNDQAHTDAVAWFALFEMLPVLRERARAFERIGVRRRAREGQRIWDLTVRPRARD